MSETTLVRRLMLEASKLGARLLRNNVGQGLMIQHKDPAAREAIIRRCIALAESAGGSAYRLQFGLHEGSGDLIGPTPVEITPDLVGQRVAVFTSIEAKGPHGRVSPAQQAWMDFVRAIGGIAAVVRSSDELANVLRFSKRSG